MYLSGDVVRVTGTCVSSSVYKSFIHIEHESNLLLACFVLDMFGNDKRVFLRDPGIEIVLELSKMMLTVVRSKN